MKGGRGSWSDGGSASCDEGLSSCGDLVTVFGPETSGNFGKTERSILLVGSFRYCPVHKEKHNEMNELREEMSLCLL